MTALIGGSVLLIAGAALALVFGWIGADTGLIWVSILASVLSAILLALGYYRSKGEVAAIRSGRGGQEAAIGGGPRPARPAPDAVIAVADRKRFHRPDCRYARVKGAEEMSAATARRRGYDPCTICKP